MGALYVLQSSCFFISSIRIPVAGPELARQRLGDLYALARLVMQRRTGGSPWPTLEAAMARCLSANRCLILGISEAMDLYPIAPATGEAPVDEPGERPQPPALHELIVAELSARVRENFGIELPPPSLQVLVREGKKHEVRRICEAIGLRVKRLKRVTFGPLKLGNLADGTWRELRPVEIKALHHAAGIVRGRYT